MREIILDIIGVAAILLSLWAYFFGGFDFFQCTVIGCVGLALFVFKGSKVRQLLEKLIDKYLSK